MSETIDADVLRELFATPPSEFVAARNALAKSLRAGGGRDVATVVTALRRPSWVDWALNALAAKHDEAVAGFADVAANLRDAQTASIEQRDGPDLRVALAGLRAAVAELSKLSARPLAEVGRPPEPAEVAARLGEVAASAAAVEQLRAGVLGSGDVDSPGPFADLRPAEHRASAKTAKTAKTKDATIERPRKTPVGAAEIPDELAARRAEREARQAEERRLAEEETARLAADAEAAAARQREEEQAAAELDVETAEGALADAEQTLSDAEQAVSDGRKAVIAAKTALRTARQRVEQLGRRR